MSAALSLADSAVCGIALASISRVPSPATASDVIRTRRPPMPRPHEPLPFWSAGGEWAPSHPKDDGPRGFPKLSRRRGANVVAIDCDDRECPECGPRLRKLDDAAHEDFVYRCRLYEYRQAFGLDEEDEQPEAVEEPPPKRTRRDWGPKKEPKHVRRIFGAEESATALSLLMKRPVLKCYRDQDGGRAEWLAEVWLELQNPTSLVARREAKLSLAQRVTKAINRAQSTMFRRMQAPDQKPMILVAVEDGSRMTPRMPTDSEGGAWRVSAGVHSKWGRRSVDLAMRSSLERGDNAAE